MNTSEQIRKAADELLPLYSQAEADLPDRPLWSHPEIDQVVEVLRIVTDVLFPGKMNSEPVDFQEYFIRQLENVADILQPEIEKALPFRWMAAADAHEKRPPINNLDQASEEIVTHFIGYNIS